MNKLFPHFDINRTLVRSIRRPGFVTFLVWTFVVLTFASVVHAERDDKNKPLNIEADNMTYDDLRQVNIFTGHVSASKGTIVIQADRIEVRQDSQGYQYATGTSVGNKFVYFRQKRNDVDEYIDGSAERIDYDGKKDLIILTTRATVRHLQGLSTIMNQVHGSVITYDGRKDFYTAKAGQDIAEPGNPMGRVRVLLSPRTGNPAPLTGKSAKLALSTQLSETSKP